MEQVAILGCGYVGEALARRAVARGARVVATTTTPARLALLEGLGAEARLAALHDGPALAAALAGADVVFHLAPPDPRVEPGAQAALLARAVSPSLRAFVYGSTTGAFGEQPSSRWVDEDTPEGEPGARGKARLDAERALRVAGLPLSVVRIAGIYGPGRTLREGLERGSLVLFEDGPPTSRVHVDDLCALLEAMARPGAPPLAIACDDEPAPTLEVARFTAALLGLALPPAIPLEEARRTLSPAALEMRLGGRRCRSRVRPALLGPLRHPTYREGVRASLVAEGALRG